jgi:hypothetical protein
LASRMPMNLSTAPRAQPLLVLAASALLVGACGYPTFSFVPVGTTSATGSTTTGTGGAGGAGGGAPGTGGDPATSSISSAASSGTSGEPACSIVHAGKKGTCEYLPQKECGCMTADEKCAVEDQATGESNCIPMSVMAKPKWSGCQTDSDCARGTWCDHRNHACEPICTTVDDCEGNQQCIPVLQDGSTSEIPGLRVCTSHCDPIVPEPPCSMGLTCVYNFTVQDFECARGANVPQSSACNAPDSCDPGLICVGKPGAYTCERWCSPAGTTNSPGCAAPRPNCKAFNPTVIRDGVSYGVCSP